MLASPLHPSFLDTYSLSMSSLGCKAFCIVIIFLFSGPFVEVLPSSILRIVPIIFQQVQTRCLFLCWDFYHIFWFQIVFSISWETLLKNFLFFHSFDGVSFQYSQILVSFLFTGRSDFFLDLVVLFLLSIPVFRFSLLT